MNPSWTAWITRAKYVGATPGLRDNAWYCAVIEGDRFCSPNAKVNMLSTSRWVAPAPWNKTWCYSTAIRHNVIKVSKHHWGTSLFLSQ
jgi:hypothetical protein